MANPSIEVAQNTEPAWDGIRNLNNCTSSPGNQFYNRTKRKRESSDGTRNNKTNQEINRLPNQAVSSTWKLSNVPMTPGIIGLHKEIEAFVDWIVPNETEHNIRLSVIQRITTTIHEVYPDCSVHIFGSFKTGLYLPTSDIDLVLVGKWDQIPFEVVSKGIERKNLAKPGTLQLLEHATVPIIKLTDNLTNIKVDISFNMTNGLKSVQLINFFKSHYPAMSKLIYVLKQFLLQRDLNEVYTGGLSSYALILMVVSFLQLHLRSDARSENPNLGVLLMEFFELYGRHFNYTNTAISIIRGGAYLSKDEVRNSMPIGLGQGHLCIQDPYNSESDVGKSSYGIPVVRTAFEKAFVTLSKLVMEKTDGILSSIIQVSDEVINFRNWAKTSFKCDSLPMLKLDKDFEELQSQSFLEDLLMRPCENQHRTCDEYTNAPKCQDDSTNHSSTHIKNRDKTSIASSSNSSDSASTHTDTDFDGLDAEVRALSPSGSSSSCMSVSPPSSEAGSQDIMSCHSSVDQGPTNNKDFEKKGRLNYKGYSRNGNRFGRNKTSWSRKERCEDVLDWRKDCLRQDHTKPSRIVVSKSQRDSIQPKPQGDEVQLHLVQSSKLNKPSSKINVDNVQPISLKIDKRSDITLSQREECNETQGGTSGCIDENFKIKTRKKKKKNQTRLRQSQAKNVDTNGIADKLPVKTQTLSAANENATLASASLNIAVKQGKKSPDAEDQLKQSKKDQRPQPREQVQSQAQNRFSSRVGQSKPKR